MAGMRSGDFPNSIKVIETSANCRKPVLHFFSFRNNTALACLHFWGRLLVASVALVLLTAAILKAKQLIDDPLLGDPVFSSRPLAIAAVNLELTLGAWLLVGIFPVWGRRAAIGCFAVFAAVSVWQASVGKASCGCFGSVRVTPWATAAFDFAILLALIRLHAPVLAASLLVRVLAVVGLLVASAGINILMLQNSAPLIVVAVPAKIELGAVRVGQAVEAPIRLTNRGTRPVLIVGFESSCPCLDVNLSRTSVEPGETVNGVVRLNLNREPDFVGSLAVTVVGLTEERLPLVRFTTEATVHE